MSRYSKAGPCAIQVEAGRFYAWCSCGRSLSQPLCDGSHLSATRTALPWRAPESGTVWFCGCKKTSTPPFCDGSHEAD